MDLNEQRFNFDLWIWKIKISSEWFNVYNIRKYYAQYVPSFVPSFKFHLQWLQASCGASLHDFELPGYSEIFYSVPTFWAIVWCDPLYHISFFKVPNALKTMVCVIHVSPQIPAVHAYLEATSTT